MHEMSLARTLWNQVHKVWSERSECEIAQVDVESGPLSGVEPLLLLTAFDQLTMAETGNAIPLVIHEVPLTANCYDCGCDVPLENFRFTCPRCGGRRLTETQGDCLKLLSIDFRVLDSSGERL